MLRLRILTGLVMVAAVLAAIFWLDTRWFGIAFGVVVLIGAWEWSSLSGLHNPLARAAYLAATAALTFVAFNYVPDIAWFATGCAWWALVTVRVLRGRAGGSRRRQRPRPGRGGVDR